MISVLIAVGSVPANAFAEVAGEIEMTGVADARPDDSVSEIVGAPESDGFSSLSVDDPSKLQDGLGYVVPEVDYRPDMEVEGVQPHGEADPLLVVDSTDEVSDDLMDVVPVQVEEDEAYVEVESSGGVRLNATEVTLYGLDGLALEKLGGIPSNKRTSFQLKVTGGKNPTYHVTDGDSVTVTAAGLIAPKYTTWYSTGSSGSYTYWTTEKPDDMTGVEVRTELEAGTSTVTVSTTAGSATVTVDVVDYGVEYMGEAFDEYVRCNVTEGMSVYDKVDLACRYVVQFPYSAEASSAYGMFYMGGGDCWASTSTIIELCTRMGLRAWSRNANRDPGAGSGHVNAMIDAGNGTYLEADAGYYSTEVPRPHSIRERRCLWTYTYDDEDDSITLMQYDGESWPEHLSIPSSIDGHTVTTLGYAFASNGEFKTVDIPSTVTRIESFAFAGCDKLKSIYIGPQITTIGDSAFMNCCALKLSVSPQNPNYSVRNNVLYNKDQTILLSAPSVGSVAIPSTVRTIGMGAFYRNWDIEELTIPASVTKIEDYAFLDTVMTDLWFESPVAPEVGEYGLDGYPDELTIHVPVGATGYDVEPWTWFTVVGPRISDAKITLGQTSYTYDGREKRPSVTVRLGGKTLREGADYDVTYADNVAVGKASAIVTGRNGYEGSQTVAFTIKRASSTIKLKAQTKTYTGKAMPYSGKVSRTGSRGKVTYRYYSDAGCTKAVAASKVKDTGTYYVRATVAKDGNYCAATSAAAKFTIAKAKNTITVKASKKTAKLAAVRKKAVSVAPIAVSKARGKVTYSRVAKGSSSGLKVNAKTGKITVKKGARKGTYKIKVKVTAKGNVNYKPGSRTVTCKVTVK